MSHEFEDDLGGCRGLLVAWLLAGVVVAIVVIWKLNGW